MIPFECEEQNQIENDMKTKSYSHSMMEKHLNLEMMTKFAKSFDQSSATVCSFDSLEEDKN